MKVSNQQVFKKIVILLGALSFIALLQPVFADHDDRRSSTASNTAQTSYVYADVTNVEPIIRYVTVSRPERVCEEVAVYNDSRHHHRSSGGAILGGLVGGVLGRQIGGGKGRDAATVAGVLIGSAIGHDNEVNNERNRNSHERRDARTREVCQTRYQRHEEERIDGYRVSYRYNGEIFTTRTNYEPGDKIRLSITARPATENYRGANTPTSSDRYNNYDRYSDYDYED